MPTIEKRITVSEPNAERALHFLHRMVEPDAAHVESPLHAPHEYILKLRNHASMLAMTLVYYNFRQKHRLLEGKNAAMAACITNYVWTASDMLSLTWGVRRGRGVAQRSNCYESEFKR